jgi:hypothetical protein
MPPTPAEQVASGKNRTIFVRDTIDPMILIQEAAFIAGVHRETLKNEARRGRLKLFRISQRKIGVRQSELNRYLCATVYAPSQVAAA